MKEKDKVILLIKIILYLLLALAFFSDFAFKSPEEVDFMIMVAFLFGVGSLILLYVGKSLDNVYFEKMGYVVSGSFVLALLWFIFNIITIGGGNTIIKKFLNLLTSNTIQLALLIPLIILIIFEIFKNKK